MKNLNKFLMIIVLITFNSISAQEIEVGNNYYFKSFLGKKITADKMNLNTSDTIPKGAEIDFNDQIKIVNIENERVYFTYLIFDKKEQPEKIPIYNFDKDNSKKIFSISKNDFEKITKPFYNRFRGFKYGAYTVPIRLRTSQGKFEFDSNFSLGANIVGRIGSRFNENLFVDISFGVGLTKINLNKENSILGTQGTDFEKIDVLSPSALTVSFGALFNLAKNVNIGAYWGWDNLSSADNKANWIYNKKPWLGIGINVSFVGDTDKSNAEK